MKNTRHEIGILPGSSPGRGTATQLCRRRKELETMTETWKPIPGWEGYYEVSDHGNVRSLDRKVRTLRGEMRFIRGKNLKLNENHNGYMYVMPARQGKNQRLWVHHAVLTAFASPRKDGKVCMHVNNNIKDNRLENLQWGTQLENIQQRDIEGRNANTRKTHCPRGHELKKPNLNKYLLRQGRRACQSCFRATQYYPLKDYGEAVVKRVADRNYLSIMAA